MPQTNSSKSAIYIKFKLKPDEDAFLTNVSEDTLINKTTRGVLTAGQITTYSTLQLEFQYCTHLFSVPILGDYAWLI
jgi:hypothetical protein